MTKRVCSIEELPITMTPREAASAIGLGKDTVYELIHTGRLEAVRVGRRILVTKTAIARFLDTT